MPLKPVTDPNKIKELETSTQSTKTPKLKPVSDPETIKALESDSGTTGSFLKGFSHNFDEYAASINKGLDWLADKVTGRDTKFFEENQKWWNKQKKLNELETAKHPYAKLAGEILLDPINLTPAGIASKGAKAARIAKSMAGGVAVGAGTMAFKNYGDQSKTQEQKQQEIALSGGIGAIVNGVIAALTKGKVRNVIKDESNPEEAKKVLQTLADNPEVFGLSKADTEQAGKAAMSLHYKSNPEEAKKFWKEIINPNQETTNYRPDWRLVPQEGTLPVKVEDFKQLHIREVQKTPLADNSIAERQSVPVQNTSKDYDTYQEPSIEENLVEYKNITDDPLFYYALDLARNRSWKDIKNPNRMVVKRSGVTNEGGEQVHIKQLTEPNYEYDFSLTKSDVKKIEKALQEGKQIPDDLLEKAKNDVGVLENHPKWRDEAQSIRHEAETVFANGTPRLATGFAGGTINLFSNGDQNDDGIITLDEAALAFGKGFLGGALAGHFAVEYGDNAIKFINNKKAWYDYNFGKYSDRNAANSNGSPFMGSDAYNRVLAVRRVRDNIEKETRGNKQTGIFGRRFRGSGSIGIYKKSPDGKINFNEKIKNELNKVGISTPDLIELPQTDEAARKFYNSIIQAKNDGIKLGKPEYAQVYVYPQEEYKNMKLLLTPDGKAGVAIKPDGDIVSVFRHPNANYKRVAHHLLLMALANGGKKLDAYNTKLPYIYSEVGFKPVAKNKWDDKYMPEDWNKEALGTPDVVYEAYDPLHIGAYNDKAPFVDSWEEAVKKQKEALGEEDGINIGLFAGSNAKSFARKKNEGRVFVGKYDKMDRFEIDDSKAKIVNPVALKDIERFEKEINRLNKKLGKLKSQSAITRTEAEIYKYKRMLSEAKRGVHKINYNPLGFFAEGENRGYKLSDILKHDELFDEYPKLKDVKVKFDTSLDDGAYFDKKNNTIAIGTRFKNEDELKSALLHEIQHAIQSIEGFARGGSSNEFKREWLAKLEEMKLRRDTTTDPFEKARLDDEIKKMYQYQIDGKLTEEAFNKYQKLAGEIEARDVEARMNYTPEERSKIEPYSSENIPEDEAILRYSNGIGKLKELDNIDIKFNKEANKKEYAPHLKRIVYERLNKEWSDISSTIKGELRRLFTNTYSGEYLGRRDKLMAAKNEVLNKADFIHKTLKELPEKDRELLHKYIVGDLTTEEARNLPEEIRKTGENMRATVKELTDELVKEGILSEGAVKEWGKFYLKRVYEKHFGDKMFASLGGKKTLEKLYERGNIEELKDSDIEALQKFLEPLGIDVGGYKSVKEFIADNENLLDLPLREGGIRIKELPNGKLQLKRDWTYEERTKMGEIRDASITVPETLIKLGTLVEHAKFLKDVAKVNGAVLTKEMAEQYQPQELSKLGYTKLPKSQRYGALSDMWVRKDVKDDIDAIGENFIDAMLGEKSILRDVWDGYLRLWKKSKTVWNAPAHVNNFLSNLFLMHLSGMKSTDIVKGLADATKLITTGKRYKELLKKSMTGRATQDELDEIASLQDKLKYYLEAENLGLLKQSQLNDILQGEVKSYNVASGAMRKVDEATERAYQMEDEVNRLAAYITFRQKGWSKEEARQGVEVIMPDYTQPMPKAWRWARDTGISPFIAWNYYTVPKILRLIRTKEGATRMAIALGSLYGLSYVMSKISPVEQMPAVDTDVPEWSKGRYIPIYTEGNKVTMVKADRWLPYLQLFHPFNYMKDLGSGITVNFANATLTGNKLYNGRPITYPQKSLGEKAYDYAKYYTESFVPLPQQLYSTVHLAESYLLNKDKRRTDKTIEPRTPTQNILKLLGINTITYNKSALKREQEKQRRR